MNIKDNVLKEQLRNVYFISGTPCGGKTTISRALGEKYGYKVYDADKEFARHQKLSNPIDQPAMNKSFKNADDFFLRPVQEYKEWLITNTREQMDFVITDLISLSQKEKIIADLHLTIEQTKSLTNPSHVVFLLRDPRNIIEDYCNRKDHDDFKRYIYSSSNPNLSKENCQKTLELLNMDTYINIKKSNYFFIEKDNNRTIEDTLKLVEEHFKFI